MQPVEFRDDREADARYVQALGEYLDANTEASIDEEHAALGWSAQVLIGGPYDGRLVPVPDDPEVMVPVPVTATGNLLAVYEFTRCPITGDVACDYLGIVLADDPAFDADPDAEWCDSAGELAWEEP